MKLAIVVVLLGSVPFAGGCRPPASTAAPEPAPGPRAVETPPPSTGAPVAAAPAEPEAAGPGPLGAACDREARCAEGLGCSGLYFDAPGQCVAEDEAKRGCASAGGEWGKWGMMGATYCMRVNPDAGKACTDRSQCKGKCIVQEDGKGACQRHETQFGCFATMVGGKTGGSMCVD